VHFWRLIENRLAVGDELQRRKIKRGIRCTACDREEDLLHRFWTCPHSAMAWEELSLLAGSVERPPDRISSHSELQWWLLDWIYRSTAQDSAIMMMHVYHLWIARNEARDAPQIDDPRLVSRQTMTAMAE
jgi:hypothetical protein